MTAATTLRQPHSEWLARLRTIGLGLGGRGVMGLGLGRSSVGAAAVPWWLSGGVAAANCVAVYQPKGAASLAASYSNLANPGTYDAAPGVAPTFDAATGWTFNGSAYLRTGIVPSHPASFVIRFAGGYTGNQPSVTAGCYDGRAFILESGYGGSRYYEYGTVYVQTGAAVAEGVMCITPTQGYLNGAADGATMAGGTNLPLHALTIGSRNDGGSVTAFWSGSVSACAHYSTSLSSAQVASISAAMAAL